MLGNAITFDPVVRFEPNLVCHQNSWQVNRPRGKQDQAQSQKKGASAKSITSKGFEEGSKTNKFCEQNFDFWPLASPAKKPAQKQKQWNFDFFS